MTPAVLRLGRTMLLALALVLCGSGPAAAYDWTTWGFDMQRTGYDPAETALSTATVAKLRLHWSRGLFAPILTQPLVLTGVSTSRGVLDLVYVGTLGGRLYALDAANGVVVWMVQLGRTQTGCADFAASHDVAGIVETPTIDARKGRLYVADGAGALHVLDVATGAELPGWPLHFLPAGEAPARNVVYGSPTLSGHLLYIATAGTCDILPYHGEAMTIDVNTATILRRFFMNGSASGPDGGGIWGPGGLSIEPDGSSVYAATGNAFGTAENIDYSEHVIQLTPHLAPVAADALTDPITDSDFGATPLLYQAAGCPPQLAAMNKNGALLIYDRSSIATGARQSLQVTNDVTGGNFIGLPAFDPVLNRLYLGSPWMSGTPADNLRGLVAMDVHADCTLAPAWQQPVGSWDKTINDPVISPVVANGVVYYAEGNTSVLAAFDAAAGTPLWNSGTTIAGGIYVSPTVANGQLYVGAFNHVIYAYGL